MSGHSGDTPPRCPRLPPHALPPSPLRQPLRFIASSLMSFLALEETEALDATADKDEDGATHTTTPRIPLWLTIVHVWLSTLR